MLLVQVHLTYFNFDRFIHLFIASMFFNDVAFGHVIMHMTYLQNDVFWPCSHVQAQCSSLEGFNPVLPIVFFHCCSHPHRA